MEDKKHVLLNTLTCFTYSVCPWKTETECTFSLKSHRRNVASLEDVTANLWLGCVEVCVNSWSCPKYNNQTEIFSLVLKQRANLIESSLTSPFPHRAISLICPKMLWSPDQHRPTIPLQKLHHCDLIIL